MKRMKKLAGILLVLTMVFALSVPAMAEDLKGSISINGVNAKDGKPVATYEIYKILDLSLGGSNVGSSTDNLAYSYSLTNDKWETFFKQDTINGVYVSIDAGNHVSWKTEKSGAADVAAFAKLALAYAEEKGIQPLKTTVTPADEAAQYTLTDGVLKFSDLPLGYYLVDSTMGALCGLTTTNLNASINAKNIPPVIDKQVKEDSTGNFTTANTADIGQIVEFQTTITVHAGAQNYVLHDKMGEGFTFKQEATINPTDDAVREANKLLMGITSITHIIPDTSVSHPMADSKYTLKVTPAADVPTADAYNDCDDSDCTFEIHFEDILYKELKVNDKIIVTYNALLNRNAEIAGDGNLNTSWVSYGEGDNKSAEDQTVTKTYKIDLVKTDNGNNPLQNAKFMLYDAAEYGNVIPVVLMYENDNTTPQKDINGNQMYRRARANETGVEIVVDNPHGQITIAGLDNGTYYLEETEAPAGYNKLTSRKSFTISDGNLDAVHNGGVYSTGSGVHVVNSTGTMLPETGGMGTVLFVTFGMLVVLGTGVLLVTKKRMAMIED